MWSGIRLKQCESAILTLDLSAFSKIDRIEQPTIPDLNAGADSRYPKIARIRFYTVAARSGDSSLRAAAS